MVEVEVTFDYVAEQPDELTIKVGDVIKNVIQSEGGWWEGELKGKKGMFPDNFVKVLQKDVKKDEKEEVKMRENKKDVQATKRQSVRDLANKIKDKVHDGPVPVRKKVSAKKRAKVVFAYEPENEDELRLSVGDMVDILKQEEEGWWEGIVNGKQGMLPSNFVEIVDESEPSLPEVTEKNEPSEGEGNLIKGKKIQGIGLGNIFGDGPIKLRPTAGKKPGDKPTEPTKVERPPQEPFERRPKDARLNTNNCANPSLTVEPSPILLHLNPLTERQIDELYTDNTQNLDYKNNNIAAFQGKARNCSLKQAAVTSFSLKSDDDMPVEIVDNLQDLDIEDLRMIENMYEDEDEAIDTFDNIVKVPHVELNVSNSSFKHESQNESDYKDQSMSNRSLVNGKYSDSLHTILDDLDNCLEMSSAVEKRERVEIPNANVNIKEWSSLEPEASTLCLIYDKDESFHEDITSEISDKAINNDNEIKGTPKSNTNFNAVVDSVLVTKRRISSGSYRPGLYHPGEINLPYSQSTPISNKRYDSSFVTPQSTNRYTHMPELPSLRDPPRTNFASLNRSGTTSPFIQSIAHKYHIFNTPVQNHNTGEMQADSDQHDESGPADSGLSESGLVHKGTDGDLPDKSGLADEITDDDDVDETPVTVEMDQDQATTRDAAVTDTQTQETKPVEKAVIRYSYKAENEDELSLTEETKPVEKAVVRYSYKAENEDELSLTEGDIITVLDKHLEDSGWWKGEINGHVGVFPDNFVELVEEEVKPQVPEKVPRPVVTPSAQPKPKRPQQPPAPVAGTKPAPKLPDKAPVVEQPKPEPVKEDKPAVIAARKPPPLTKKPVKPADTHEDKNKSDHVNVAGSFEAVEPASEKLTHLTANRARGPAKRPPSQVFTQNPKTNTSIVKDEERNGDIKDSHKEDRMTHIPPTLAERKEEKSVSHHSVPARPTEPPAANPGILSAIEELKREISDLKTNTVSKSAYNELKSENDKLRQDLDSLKATYSRRLKDIMAEVDEEKKIRLSTQVEMERIRKLVAESHV